MLTTKGVLNGKEVGLEVLGNFEFEVSPLFYNPSNEYPYHKYSFEHSKQTEFVLSQVMDSNQVIELIAEKLKQDFIELLKSQSK